MEGGSSVSRVNDSDRKGAPVHSELITMVGGSSVSRVNRCEVAAVCLVLVAGGSSMFRVIDNDHDR